MTMYEIPPAEAFDPRPDLPGGGGGFRRRVQIGVTLTLVAALVALAAVEGGGYIIRGDAVQATAPPALARIAAVDAAGALTTRDGHGDSVVEYAVPGVAFQFPTWSPDGSRLAAIGQGATDTGVYVFAARTAADATIAPIVVYQSSDRPPFYLYWTPDGGQLSFLTTEPDGLALRIVAATAEATDRIVRSGAPMYWEFQDAGRLLVHSGSSGPDSFLGEVALDGTPFESSLRAPGVFRAPTTSADGRYRAYVAPGDGTGEVVLESRNDGGTRRIRVFGPAAVSFGPTGDELAFVAPNQPNGGNLPLPVGPLQLAGPGSAPARTLVGGSVVAYFWSPTGKEIAVLRLEDPENPVTQAGRGTGIALARADVAAQEAAAGLPLHLAFVEVASGSIRSERVIRLSDLFVNQLLPYFDQYALSHRVWSADGSAVVLPIVGDGDVTQLVVIPSDGSAAQTVATGEAGFWSP